MTSALPAASTGGGCWQGRRHRRLRTDSEHSSGHRVDRPLLCREFTAGGCHIDQSDPVQAMLDSTTANVIGTHPLFGPAINSLQGQRVVMTTRCP